MTTLNLYCMSIIVLFVSSFNFSQGTAEETSLKKTLLSYDLHITINTIIIIWVTNFFAAISVSHIHCHIVPRGWRGCNK